MSHGAFEQGPVSAVREWLHKGWNHSTARMDAPASRQDMTHAVSSGRYELRSSSYAARRPYQINFSGTPDGKLSNKNRNAIKITIKKLHEIAWEPDTREVKMIKSTREPLLYGAREGSQKHTLCVWSLDFHSNMSNYRPLSERHMKTHSLRDSLLLDSHDIPGGTTGGCECACMCVS